MDGHSAGPSFFHPNLQVIKQRLIYEFLTDWLLTPYTSITRISLVQMLSLLETVFFSIYCDTPLK